MALLVTALQAVAQPYMSDAAFLARDMPYRLSVAPLIQRERQSGRVPPSFAAEFLALRDGEVEYAQRYADETGQGRTIRANAERRSAAVLAARTLPDWLAGYPEPSRVVSDIRNAANDDDGYLSGGQIVGRLTLLRRTMRREVGQRGDGEGPPGADRLYWLYGIYIADVIDRLKPVLQPSDRDCSGFTRLMRNCTHQLFQSA